MTGVEAAALAPWILGTAVAGTAIAGYSAYSSGQSAKRQAKSQSAWQNYNAQVAEREAQSEEKASAFETAQHKRQSDMLLARQRALIGVSGVTPEGSPLLVMEDTARQLAMENANIAMAGERRAAGYKSQSILDRSMASASKSAASDYGRASYINAGSALLQGGSQAGYNYYMMKK